MDTYADDLAALVEKLDLREAIHVGHSTGGGEVARYISHHGSKSVVKAYQSRAERQNPLHNRRNVPLASSVNRYFYVNLPRTLSSLPMIFSFLLLSQSNVDFYWPVTRTIRKRALPSIIRA
jgi:pimeloyl-ACP methyl ester carboxylesterase